MRHNKLFALGLMASLLFACDEETIDDKESKVKTGLNLTDLNPQGSSSTLQARFSVPEGDAAVVGDAFVLPLERVKTASQASLSAPSYDYFYPFFEYWQYKDLQPHPELYCDEPAEGEFADVAKSLGGFRKTTSIFIEPDATAPVVQSGWMVDQFLLRSFAEGGAESADGSVTIQRPNVVGRSGSKAFYQSDIYGLITVDFANVPFEEPKVSCAQPLPGTPKNFVVTDDNLYVILQDSASMSSGVIQFDVSGATPVYVKGVILKDQDVIDARLFNDTLVMYLKTYAPIEVLEEQEAPIAKSGLDVEGMLKAHRSLPYYSRQYVYHELVVMDTLPVIEVTNRESFIPEGADDPVGDNAPEPEDVYTSRYFNNFLSASGEYLLVTENLRERHFVQYETKSYNRCDEYKATEVPYHYCRTQWKRIENPDYAPPPSSGVIACAGKLSECLKSEGPKVSRYINIPDGEKCYDGVHTKYSCLASTRVTYEVPKYRWEAKTQVYAFRFKDGAFVRLDDQLATINKEQAIVTTERSFVIDGRVQKHDHMQFNGDNLYIIASGSSNTASGIDLHTLTIAGNSPVYVNHLLLDSQKYSNLSAAFTEDTIYLTDGNFSSSSSGLATLSLADPLAPTVNADVQIATRLSQLFFTGDGLLGTGSTTIGGENNRQTLGTISRFNSGGVEQNSLLLGGDYQYYSSRSGYDDQLTTVDHIVRRLFLPYTVSNPLLGNDLPRWDYRLTVADFSEDQLKEEGTLSFPQQIHRTLSINEETAFGFSQEFIHQMSFADSLTSATIFDGEVPHSIYYASESPTQIQKRIQINTYNFKLIDSDEAASGTLLDEVTVPKVNSSACFSEQVLFDRDRVVVVSEKPNTYIDYNDCPEDRSQSEKVYVGYRISDNKFVAITDQKEMEMLWVQSNWDMVCITDMENDDGDIVYDFDLDSTDSLGCFTRQQYQEIAQEKTSDLLN